VQTAEQSVCDSIIKSMSVHSSNDEREREREQLVYTMAKSRHVVTPTRLSIGVTVSVVNFAGENRRPATGGMGWNDELEVYRDARVYTFVHGNYGGGSDEIRRYEI